MGAINFKRNSCLIAKVLGKLAKTKENVLIKVALTTVCNHTHLSLIVF